MAFEITLAWDLLEDVLPNGDDNPIANWVKRVDRAQVPATSDTGKNRTTYQFTDIRDVPAADLLLVLSTAQQYGRYADVYEYPAWLEIDASLVGQDLPSYLNASQVDDGGLRNRQWQELSGYQVVESRHFVAASNPSSSSSTPSGSAFYTADNLLKLHAETNVSLINSFDIPAVEAGP